MYGLYKPKAAKEKASSRKHERKSRHKSDGSHEHSKDKIEEGLRLAPAEEPSLLLHEEQESRREKAGHKKDHDEFYSSEEFDAPGAVHISGGHATEVGEVMTSPSSQRPTGTLIEAELADDTDERRQQELEARTIRLEQQLQDFRRQQDGAVVVAVENTETAQASETKRRLLLLYCTIILVAIAIAGGVTAGIVLQKEESTTDATQTDSPVVPTTESPTESVPFYDPPSEEDCLAIANNGSVEDQNLLVAKALEMEFDVTLNGEQVVSSWLDDFTEKMEEYLALLLTGCLEDTQQDVVAGDQGSTRHHRKLARNIRYVIANVIASGKYNIDQSCQAGAEQPCYRIFASLQLFLKGDETVLSLVTLITDLLESDQADRSLVERLDLPSSFKTVEVVGTNNLNTESPTSHPTRDPTPNPTRDPTPNPTRDPTPNPTSMLSFQSSNVCYDDPSFVDPWDDPCDWYKINENPGCERQGGAIGTCSATRRQTVTDPVRACTAWSSCCYCCQNYPGFEDSFGEGCEWYEKNQPVGCRSQGTNPGTCGGSSCTANKACCHCWGDGV